MFVIWYRRRCTTIETSVCPTFSYPRTAVGGTKVSYGFSQSSRSSLNGVPVPMSLFRGGPVTDRCDTPVLVVSLGDDLVTDHLVVPVPSGVLESDLLDVRTLRSRILDDIPDVGRFGTPVEGDPETSELGVGLHKTSTQCLSF